MDPTSTKDIYIAPKEIAPGIFSTGGVGQMNSITSDTLNAPSSPLVLPDPTPVNYGGLQGATEGTVTGAKTSADNNLELLKTQVNDSGNAYLKELLASSGISSSVDRTAENAAKIKSDEYLSQLEQEQLANRRATEEMTKNFQGTTSGLSSAIAANNRTSLSKQADIAILFNSANRSYDTAKSIADRAVSMKVEESKVRLQALEFFYSQNKENFTKADDRLYSEAVKKADREYNSQLEVENKIRDLKLNVAQYAGSAAAGILEKLSAIDTKDKEAYNKAVSIAGKYQSDPLDRAIKQATLNKLNTPEVKAVSAPNITKINGVDKQWDPTTGQWVEPNVSGASSTTDPVVTEKSFDDIKKLKSLSKPSVALATSAGALRGAPIPLLYKDKINDWRANVKNILAQSTLAELVRVKGSGVTFGALSEGERQAVAAASTALNAAMIYKGSGDNKEPTGKFKASEKFVSEQIGLIEKYAEIDFKRRTGMSTEDYEASKYIDTISPALETVSSPYSTYLTPGQFN